MRSSWVRSALIAVASAAALGAAPERVAVSGRWSVYRIGSGSSRECFMHAAPVKSEGKYGKRGEVMIQITHRPAERVHDEVSFTAGYTYKPGSDVAVEIDGRKFELFVHQDRAYARDAATDKALTLAMQRGREMRVRGVSSRGTKTLDHYSLAGFSRAYASLDKACGG